MTIQQPKGPEAVRQRLHENAFANVDRPKEPWETYYYTDGLGQRRQLWITHTPGVNIPIRIKTIHSPGIFPGEEYDAHLLANLGSEQDAYKLYRALEHYFNDRRVPPWWADEDVAEAGSG